MRTAAPHRVGDWIVHAKVHSTSLSPDRSSVYSFDLEGRPLSWFTDGRTYKRSLASDVHLRERVDARKLRRRLTLDEATGSLRSVLEVAERVPVRDAPPLVRERVRRILGWSVDSLVGERERFDAVYRPVGILPPDQYLAVVLQATYGCSWNRCTFCSFYQDQPFHARDAVSFEEHCGGVRGLLGDGESLRRSVFLASGNCLMLSNQRLQAVFRAALEQFPGKPFAGFVDVFTGERKSREEWSELRDLGLERVHVGLETGCDRLLDWLNKPGSADASAAFVASLAGAGLKVAVILMVGVGGRQFACDHERETIALVKRLPLGRGDIVYLSPFLEQADSDYARRSTAEGVVGLDEGEIEAQYLSIRSAIRRAHPAVTVARYDIREFVY